MKYTIKITQNDFTVLSHIGAELVKETLTLHKEATEEVVVYTEEFDTLKEIPELNFNEPVQVEIFNSEFDKKAFCRGTFPDFQDRFNINMIAVRLHLPILVKPVLPGELTELLL